MIDMGILDPTKVTRTALQNAASVASLMLTTEAMVAEAPKDESAGGGMPGGGMGGMGGMGAWTCDARRGGQRRRAPPVAKIGTAHGNVGFFVSWGFRDAADNRPDMVQPNVSGPMRRFVDDELLRAPLLADQAIEETLDHLRKTLPTMLPRERAVIGDLLQAVLTHRQHVVSYFVRSLREHITDELSPRPPAAPAPAAAPAQLTLSLAPLGAPSGRGSLSLVDEDEVAIDVELAHAIEAIRSVAEYELRELQTYVSALVGDMEVARDHNPFRAEAQARALWAGAQALPLSRGYQIAFMRHASLPLARVLRKAYAGASTRLEAAGVVPAMHRTLILPGGARRPRASDITFVPDLERIRSSMPVGTVAVAPKPTLEQMLAQADGQIRALPADAGAAAHARLRQQQRAQWVASATTQRQQQLIELITRLFEAILSDRELAPDVHLLLARLQAPALRVALRDPTALDQHSHPLWQMLDRIAFMSDTLPPPGHPGRENALRFVRGLLDHLSGHAVQETALYAWALERLSTFERHRFEQRCGAAAAQIASLQALEDQLHANESPLTMHGALDVAQLDTVPAELFDGEPAPARPASSAQLWLDARRTGDWLRVLMQGRWSNAQLLWPGDRGELWLLADSASDATWAVRRGALLTLHAANLLDALVPRSLMREAAKRVLKTMTR